MRSIEYEPRNVKEILTAMKDTSELMVDLAYSAVLYRNREMANEVLELEEHMNVLVYHARISLMMAARNTKEAKQLAGVFQIADAAENISNAAKDIARVMTSDIGISDEFRAALPEAEEVIMRTKVKEGSILAGKTLEEINLETDTGVRLIAIRRDDDWIFDPGPETHLHRDDVMFGEGPRDGVKEVHEKATGGELVIREYEGSEIENLEKAIDIAVEMKDVSELAVGLGYSAALFQNKEIAGEVRALEADTDDLMQELQRWVLESARQVDDINDLRGILQLAVSSEEITDAALQLADAVMRDIELHPVFEQALGESSEIITKIYVEEGSELEGMTLGGEKVESETGMHVMGIRGEDGWVYRPKANTEVLAGDVLIVRGTRAGSEKLGNLSSRDRDSKE
ncbi:MAG: potassium channel family protein [Halobacteria archaeon]